MLSQGAKEYKAGKRQLKNKKEMANLLNYLSKLKWHGKSDPMTIYYTCSSFKQYIFSEIKKNRYPFFIVGTFKYFTMIHTHTHTHTYKHRPYCTTRECCSLGQMMTELILSWERCFSGRYVVVPPLYTDS
jgi:hypothetical protein